MKLLRFKYGDKIKVGYLNEDIVVEIAFPMSKALISPDILLDQEIASYPLRDIQFLPPVSPSKVVCVGLNYRDHALELNMDIPEEPIIFLKPSTGVIGHQDNIIYPEMSQEVDYEVEIAVVVSKEAKNVRSQDAEEYIGGCTVLNDVTARDLQRKDGQWTRAKSFDTFCPLGPCIETDLDPQSQDISLKLNGEIRQNSNTKNMIFGAHELLEFVSNIMTLNPGDIIATGTPPGVGQMQPGDVVQAQVEDIGILENQIIKL